MMSGKISLNFPNHTQNSMQEIYEILFKYDFIL